MIGMCSGIFLPPIARSKASVVTRSIDRLTSRPLLPTFSALASFRSFGSIPNCNLRSTPTPLPRSSKAFRPSLVAKERNIKHLTTVRYCSHQRSMCRLSETVDVVGGGMDVSKGRELLPTNVKPLHYALTLEPDFENFTYEGEVVIE